MWKRSIFRFFCFVVLLSLPVSVLSYYFLNRSLDNVEDEVFSIHPNQSAESVARQLAEEHIIAGRYLFLLPFQIKSKMLSVFGISYTLKTGEYYILPSMSILHLLKIFSQGKTVQKKIPLIEGERTASLFKKLSKTTMRSKDILELENPQLFKKIGIPSSWPSLEGVFLSETYFYQSSDSVLSILKEAHQLLIKTLWHEWANRAHNLPYKGPYDALIMASIIELESGRSSERALISSVFVNRLRKHMRLQTDPTVIYGIKNFDGNIRRKDLETKTPYNTYRIKGLPPTPIANVGRESIHLALHPADAPYLYFVAKGDGTHYFSKTLKEHNQAVRKYQLHNAQ